MSIFFNLFGPRQVVLNPVEKADAALRSLGIGNYGDPSLTGEARLLKFLSAHYQRKRPIIFDVGANLGATGNYRSMLRAAFPHGRIYAFEPNPQAYKLLLAQASDQQNERLALGKARGTQTHYTYNTPEDTELASSNPLIFEEVFRKDLPLASYEVKVETLDRYCHKHQLKHINFLKVDVEGGEYDVLLGGQKLISQRQIDFIQFEFNIHNIYSRIFVKDFFLLLKGYSLYRLTADDLVPLVKYSTDYEIFRYQNFLASSKPIKSYEY